MKDTTSIFIVPRSSTSWRGNEAGWITTSGWAAAGQQLWGEAMVATTDGIFTPQESRLFPRGVQRQVSGSRGKLGRLRKFVPEVFITAYKDWNLKRSKPSVWPVEHAELGGKKVMMVWERHDLFPGPGRRLADQVGAPFVISVEAPAVWEAEKWGTKRPGWGRWLEKNVEAKSLQRADLVSCVSDEVREKVIQMGVGPERVIVSPNRVDSTLFNPEVDGNEVAAAYALQGKRVIGWTGSFRNFHGLDSVLLAFKKVRDKFPDTVLMLVGDGQGYERIKAMATDLGISEHVIFTGRQPFTSIPKFVANFYIGLVSAASAEGFHYSPLKLREYMATGCATIAPKAGNLATLFQEGKDLLLYEAGNAEDLADKVMSLLKNSEFHATLVRQSKSLFEKEGTWVHELKIVCDRLSIGY